MADIAFTPPIPYNQSNAVAAALNGKQKLGLFEYAALYGTPFLFCRDYGDTSGGFVQITEFAVPAGKLLLITSIQHTFDTGTTDTMAQCALGWNTGNISNSQLRVFSQFGSSAIPTGVTNMNDRINYSIPMVVKPSDSLWHQLACSGSTRHTVCVQGYLVDFEILNHYV